MPKKRACSILYLFLCTCGVEPAVENPATDELAIPYASLSDAERAVIDDEYATAKLWTPVHEAYARAVRAAREAGR